MAKTTIKCPYCKAKQNDKKMHRITACHQCGNVFFDLTETKVSFFAIKKLTGVVEKNQTKQKQDNLFQIQQSVDSLYQALVQDIGNGSFKQAEQKLIQLFQELGAKSTEQAYDKFRRLKKKNRLALMKSNAFQLLHQDKRYRPLLDDMIVHAYHRRRKDNRIKMVLEKIH